jgi:peptidoglycan hydrolase-like protein with peptidoglycan-binding domain
MRYTDFKLVETHFKEQENPFGDIVDAANGGNSTTTPAPDDGSRGQNNQTSPTDDSSSDQQEETVGLEAGPPYPQEDRDAVRTMQTKLEELGYSVGSTGIDGKYGPRTSRAVRAFKRDNNIPTPNAGRSMSQDELTTLSSATPVDNPTATGNEGADGGSARYDLPPLLQSDVQGRVGSILDFISQYESRGRYDMRNGGTRDPRILDMTIAEILQYQRSAPWPNGESSAIGRYQYIPTTLRNTARQMGLDINNVKFDEDTQDQLAIYTLRQSCGLDQWLRSDGGERANTRFINGVAQIWSAIPQSNNRSAHRGIGSNRRGLDFSQALAMVGDIHQSGMS